MRRRWASEGGRSWSSIALRQGTTRRIDMTSSGSNSAIVLELAEEFLARYRRGERPSLQEYVDRHPDLATQIREIFPAMALLENIAIADDSLASPPAQLEALALTQLGDYRILREIGRRAMGIVYEAEQLSLGRHVALKVLPATLPVDAQRKLRFEREARAAARLHHTNIVPVFGVGSQDGMPYYVMQFIQGLAMNEVLSELQRLRGSNGNTPPASATAAQCEQVARSLLTGQFDRPPASAPGTPATLDLQPAAAVADQGTPKGGSAGPASLSVPLPGHADSGQKPSSYWYSIARIGVQVANALEYAHHQGILHRDIKPGNLLLDMRGTVWVTDFGLAKTDDQHNLTHTGDILGTLRYLPPEAFEGHADCRSDVYSLGLTLYELLALRPAFDETDRNRLIKQVTSADPARLDKVNAAIPRDLVTIVHKAIEREPAHRYATAAELAADLQRFLDDEPIRARRIGIAERFGRWCRRNPVVAGLSAAVMLTLLAGTALSTYFALDAAAKAEWARKQEAEAQQSAAQAQAASDSIKKKHEELQAHHYAAQVSWIPVAMQSGNVSLALELLELTRPKPGEPDLRGFEWHYWNRQLHGEQRSWKLPDLDGSCVFSGDLTRAAVPRFTNDQVGWDLWSAAGLHSTWPEGDRGYVLLNQDGTRIAEVFEVGGNPPHRRWLIQVWQTDTKAKIFEWSMDSMASGELVTLGWGGVYGFFSPGGDRLAIVTKQAKRQRRSLPVWRFHLWSMGGKQEPVIVEVRDCTQWFVHFSPDGQRLVGPIMHSDNSATLPVWEVATGKLLSNVGIQAGLPFDRWIAVSPDNKILAVLRDGAVHLVDMDTGQTVPMLGLSPSDFRFRFSPDGKKIAGLQDHENVSIWEVATGRELQTLRGHPCIIEDFGFSADGRHIRTAMSDGTIKEWDATADDGPLLFAPPSIFVNRQGSRVLQPTHADNKPCPVRVLDFAGKELRVVQGHRFHVGSMSCQADGPLVVSVGYPGALLQRKRPEVLVWNSDTGEVRFSLDLPIKIGWGWWADAFLSPDGKWLALSFTQGLPEGRASPPLTQVFDVNTGQFLAPEIPGSALSISPDSRFLIVGQGGCLRVWNVAEGKEKFAWTVNGLSPFRTAIDPASLRLAVEWGQWPSDLNQKGHKRDFKVYSLVSGKEQCAASLPHDGFDDVVLAFSPDSKCLAISEMQSAANPRGGAPVVRVVDALSGKEVLTLRGHRDTVKSMAFSPDGKRLATIATNELKLWDMTTGREMLHLPFDFYHYSHPSSVSFSQDGHYLIGISDRGVKRWNATPLPGTTNLVR
jgi:serine/threonine protein kinase/WD40 repeat protein